MVKLPSRKAASFFTRISEALLTRTF
jgi:hypothetical protein